MFENSKYSQNSQNLSDAAYINFVKRKNGGVQKWRYQEINLFDKHSAVNHAIPGGCFTNVSQALQDILSKFVYCRNRTSYENFKLKLCTRAQSPALGTRTKFQLEILTINVISGMVYFREIFLESSRNVSETTPWPHPIPSYRVGLLRFQLICQNRRATDTELILLRWLMIFCIYDTVTNKIVPGPILQTIFDRNSNSMEISFCSRQSLNKMIAIEFWTWYDNYALMACAEFCSNMQLQSSI